MTMGDHGQMASTYHQRVGNGQSQSAAASSAAATTQAANSNSPNKYPYNHVTRSANKMLASYTLPGQMMRSNNNNNNIMMYGHHHQQQHQHLHQNQMGMMQPPSTYTVLGNVHSNGATDDHCSLPSSDIGEVDLDLWDLDINAPSVSPQSGGHLSPAVPPGRRSSDTSSTSGDAMLALFSFLSLLLLPSS